MQTSTLMNLPHAIGFDWDEDGGVFAVTNREGKILKSMRLRATDDGLKDVVALASEYPLPDGSLPPMVVESTRRPILYAIQQSGIPVWVTNADALGPFRAQMRGNTKQKNDRADAAALAHRLLMFPQGHRPLQALNGYQLKVSGLARLNTQLRRDIVDQSIRLRSVLAKFNPAVLQVWDTSAMGRSQNAAKYLLAIPTGRQGAEMTVEQISATLREAGAVSRNRQNAERLATAYKDGYLYYDLELEEATAAIIRTNAQRLLSLHQQQSQVATDLGSALQEHPLTSLLSPATGLGDTILPMLISEIGDDQQRFSSRRGFLAYLGVIPYTAQSGGSLADRRRNVKGNRAHAAMYQWAESVRLHNDGAEYYYWTRRDKGDHKPTAIRKIAERLASCVWHCWMTGEVWDDAVVWREPPEPVDDLKARVKSRTATRGITAVNHRAKRDLAA